MGPDLDFNVELKTAMDVSPTKEGLSTTLSEKQKNSSEDNNFITEALPNKSSTPCRSEGSVINVTNVIDSDDKGPMNESEELTESSTSSSFGDTDSGTENGAVSNGLGVKSELYDDGTSMHTFDRFSDLLMRKKRLTPHWRSFIRPLIWRLKWTELKIRILEAEAAKYGKKIAGHGFEKDHELQEFTADERSVKCSPIPCPNKKVKIMKRRKRKCLNDILLYMSQHHLFSYCVNKKSSAAAANASTHFATPAGTHDIPMKFNMDELDFNGGWQCLESKDDEILEDILQKIELAKLHLDALKFRADKVARENAERICASRYLGMVASQSSLRTFGNPEGAFSSHEKVTTFPDAVKATEYPSRRLATEKVEDELLMYNNHPIKEEIKAEGQPSSSSNPSTSVQQVQEGHKDEDQEPNSQSKRSSVQSAKVRSLSRLNSPQNRRKRARRKARSSRWSRRSSG